MSVPGLEGIDPCVEWETFCSVLFGPDGIRQKTGDAL